MTEFIITCDSELKPDGSYDVKRFRELVRCMNCKNGKPYAHGKLIGCEKLPGLFRPDWFCADGERKQV